MTAKRAYKPRLAALLAFLVALVMPASVQAQVTTYMINGDTVFLDGCAAGYGIIYDNGGPAGNYSNNFEGWVVIRTNPGVTVSIVGNYNTEGSSSDYLTVWEQNTLIYNNVGGYGSLVFTSTSGWLVIRFRSDGSYTQSGFSLTWSVDGTSATCSNAVSALTASNISSTSVDLVWTADMATGPFTVEYNGIKAEGIPTTSYSLTNLNPNTRYVISVMATADTANRCCADHTVIRTDCGASTFPYSEGFEDFAEDSFPTCWLLQKNFDVIEYNPRIDAAHSSSGYRSLMLSCGDNNTAEHFGMVASPCFAGTGNRMMHLKMRASHSNTFVMVGICDSNGVESNDYGFTPVATLNVGNTWEEYRVDWTATSSGQRLAFRMLQSQQYGTGRMVYLDDLGIEACGIDSVRATHIDYDQLTLVWSTFGNPNCNVTVRRVGANSDTISMTDVSSPLVITGLQAEHTYTFTVQPYCGTQPSFGRGTMVTMPVMPVDANNYCTDFRNSPGLPIGWTFLTAPSSSFSKNEYGIYFHSGYYPASASAMVSERLLNLAGKRVVIEYIPGFQLGGYGGYRVRVGTLQYADDTSSFVQIGSFTSNYDNRVHTFTFDVPTTNTGRHLAIIVDKSNYVTDGAIKAVEIGKSTSVTEHHYVVHRRGTSVQLDWSAIYDTVLVQYGIQGFTIGNGQVDTFYHSRRGTVTGLMTSTNYDFYIYRAGGQPCPDRVVNTRTATADYQLPYCESFAGLNENHWGFNNGDWARPYTVNSTPRFGSYPYDYVAGRMLEMASWGFSNSYYGMVELPDVEIDSSTIMSFYASGTYPDAKIVVYSLPNYYNKNCSNSDYGNDIHVIDTILLGQGAYRTRYNYHLPPSTTLFDRHLVLKFYHTHEYEFYRAYFDELQFAHASYGSVRVLTVGSDTVRLSLSGLTGTDSATLTVTGGGVSYTKAIGLADTAAFGFGGLQPNTRYNVYVHPYDGGCNSYATHFYTPAEGGVSGIIYANCFPMSDVLSYELPLHWATTDTHNVNNSDELELPAGSAMVMNPSSYQNNYSLVFHAHSTVAGDTLIVGAYSPADTINTDSTHFTFDPTLFTPIDTLLLSDSDMPYSLRLPSIGTGNRRLCFMTGQGITALANIGVYSCAIVHFTPDGDGLICTTEGTGSPLYYLTIDDSDGTLHRELRVDESPFRVIGLEMGKTYYVSVRCPYSDAECTQDTVFQMGNQVSLPYCEFFDQYYTNIVVPAAWKIINTNSYQTVQPTDGSLYFNNGSNQWQYVVLPEFTTDSALSVYVHFQTHNSNGALQVGVMDDENNTASFVPVYSLSAIGSSYWQDNTAEVDLSNHLGKRVVIRFRNSTYLYSVRAYGIPVVKYGLVHAGMLRMSTATDHPYWMRESYGNTNTVIHVTDNPYYQSFNTNDAYVTPVMNTSASSTCENSRYMYLGYSINVPFCMPSFDNYCFTYYNSIYSTWRDGQYYRAFYPGAWVVLPECNIDSIRRIYMRVDYRATTATDSLVVGVMTDAYDTLTFVPVDTLTYTLGDTTRQRVYVDFSNYADSGRWVAMHYLNRSNGSRAFYISSLYADTCIGAMGATATLYRWNRVKIDAQAVPFYAEYFPVTTYSGQGQPGNTVIRIDSVPTYLTLAPDTKYDFYFHCDSTGVSCRQNQRVKTLASPLYVPGCVDFDTVTVGNLPGSNWSRKMNAIGVTNVRSHSGTRSLAIPIASNAYVVTPDADIDSLQRVAMSIWYYTEDASDRLVVGVMSNPDDMNTYHPIRTLAPGIAGTWQRGLVEFSSAPEDAFFIVLHARSNHLSNGRSIYVDDIYLDTNIAFDLRVAEIASNSLTLDWRHIGSPDVTITVMDGNTVVSTYTQVEPPLLIEPLSIQHYYTILFDALTGDESNDCNTNFHDTLSLITPAPGVGCVNATDLNSPQAVFFSGTYDNPYAEAGAVNYGSLHPDSRHTVCYDTAQRDPRTGNQLRTIPEGYTSSVRLGNWSTNYFEPEAEGVIYSLFVDTSSFELLLLRYAAVLQDPNHASADQPRFRMELLDTNYNIIDSACTSADFIANQNLGWHSEADGVLWKDWTAVGVDLSGHAGEQVYFRLTTYDCNEGLHYGYAYFTLECMRKNMNTVSCGDVDSNTLSAPEGFNYRWYTNLSGATVSTAQKITVPSEDITYYCEVSKLDNPSCNFTISAYGGTRYPMAAFDTSMVVDSCRFYVTFINNSGVSNDGVNLLPGERCETYYWDFGNGSISTSLHPSVVYTQPGTYIVRLISGIALDECQDTAYMTLVLDLPPGMAPSDTDAVSICDNQWYLFFGQQYNTAGTYYHNVPVPNSQCDSIYVLQLDVRPTSASDTVATVCDSITWRGNFYDSTGVYMSAPVGLNTAGCDSTRRLALTVNYSKETVDSIVICPGYPFTYLGIDYGGPVAFDMLLSTRQNCDSLVHVTLFERDSTYHLETFYRFDSTDWTVTDSLLIGCAPTTLDVMDTTTGASARLWSFFMRDTAWTWIDTVLTVQFDTFRNDMTAYLALDVTDTLGCHDTLTWPVFIFSKPLPEFRWEPEVPAMHNPEAQFFNLSEPDSCTYLWRIQTMEGGGFDTTSSVAPLYHWGEEGDNMVGDYTVRLIDSLLHSADSFRVDTVQWVDSTLRSILLYEAFTHTCIDSVEHIVTITNDYLQFPNLVTPNGDGTNDTWEVVNLIEFGNYQMNELWIYDRTGALVYHAKNIVRTDQFWDPNATRSPDGTYYFRFTARGPYGLVKRNGTIEVLR